MDKERLLELMEICFRKGQQKYECKDYPMKIFIADLLAGEKW